MTTNQEMENERLAALDRYDALDTPSEPSFDRITRITKNALAVPMASVSLIDGHRQWLKSRQGPMERESCKDVSFCNVAIRQFEPLIIEDATLDERFKHNRLVLGPPFIRAYAGAQLRTPDGYALGALCGIDTKPRRFEPKDIAVLQDLADMVMSEFEALKLARTDSLTGVLTRRGFRDESERALALSSRYRHSLSCIAFDLDHFKAINDRHGHDVGDRVLVGTARACHERLRRSDIFGRMGGEEFAIVLPHTDAAGALQVAEQIRAGVEEQEILEGGAKLKVSASFGIASCEGAIVPLDELLKRADMALYAAKDGGRNACVTWQAPSYLANVDAMRRVLKAGQIVFNAGRSTIDCTVRGLCESAARLDVVSTADVPQAFKLAIAGDGFSRACKVTAKDNRRLEVAFA
jgi:diguanylate cyclase (GGDEF)-like protein